MEDVPEVFLEVEEGSKMQPKDEDVDEEPPSTQVILRADALKSLCPTTSHINFFSCFYFFLMPLFPIEVCQDCLEPGGIPSP